MCVCVCVCVMMLCLCADMYFFFNSQHNLCQWTAVSCVSLRYWSNINRKLSPFFINFSTKIHAPYEGEVLQKMSVLFAFYIYNIISKLILQERVDNPTNLKLNKLSFIQNSRISNLFNDCLLFREECHRHCLVRFRSLRIGKDESFIF